MVSPSPGFGLSTLLLTTMLTGIGGGQPSGLTVTVVVATADGQPAIAAGAWAAVGFGSDEVKPFGPVHEYVAPATVEAKRLIVSPLQNGPPLPAAGADGAALTITFVVAGADGQPLTVAMSEYVPAIAVVALPIDGFCAVEVKPFGPVHA